MGDACSQAQSSVNTTSTSLSTEQLVALSTKSFQ